MLMLSVTGGGRKTGILRQRSERLGRRRLLLRDASLQSRLLVQLRRRRNVGKVSILAMGFHAATQTMAARSFASGALTRDPNPLQAVAGHIVLLVGHDATLHVESIPFGLFPHTLSVDDGFLVRFHRRRQYLHVHVRRHEIVFFVSFRFNKIFILFVRRPLRHSVKRTDRKCCCDFRLIR